MTKYNSQKPLLIYQPGDYPGLINLSLLRKVRKIERQGVFFYLPLTVTDHGEV